MNYYRPLTLSDALSWLSENNAGIAAGCTDLFAAVDGPYLHKREHDKILDVTAIDGLSQIERTDVGLRIGAAATWRAIIDEPLPPAFDGLKAAAREVGSVQIQNSGTIGGNLCNASPAADGVPPLLTLDAQVELASTGATRTLPLDAFLKGPRDTELRGDEILTAILIPQSSMGGMSGFSKLGARKYLVISIAMVAVRLEIDNDKISQAAISAGSCSAVAQRLGTVEDALIGMATDVDLRDVISAQLVGSNLSPIDDIRADAGYRLKAAREIVIRACAELLGAACNKSIAR